MSWLYINKYNMNNTEYKQVETIEEVLRGGSNTIQQDCRPEGYFVIFVHFYVIDLHFKNIRYRAQ